jgi:hypothetical protein
MCDFKNCNSPKMGIYVVIIKIFNILLIQMYFSSLAELFAWNSACGANLPAKRGKWIFPTHHSTI